MKKLDKEKLINGLQIEIEWHENEAKAAADLGWYEKAAKYEITKRGLQGALHMIRSGDYTIKE